MNKLTITDKVFVPRNANDSALIHYTKKVYDTSPNGFKLISDVKEETNKYVLSKEELEKVISDAFDRGSLTNSYINGVDTSIDEDEIKNKYINSIL
jgi:hypothetical protein